MRIKPYIILGLGTVIAAAALVTVVTVSDPYTAESGMVVLFWLAGFLAVWGLVSTVLNILHMRLAPSLGIGFLWAVAGTIGVVGGQHGLHGIRFLGGLLAGTLLVSLFLWRRSKLAQ